MTDTTAALPCTIHLRDGQQFVVENAGDWSYIPQGIYASGFFSDGPFSDVVIPEGEVCYIAFDRGTLKSRILPVGPDAD